MSLLAEKLTPCHAFLTLLFVSVVASAQTSPAIRSEVKERARAIKEAPPLHARKPDHLSAIG